MPINYLKIQQQIPDFIESHHQSFVRRKNLRSFAQTLLQAAAQDPGRVDQLIERAKQNNQYLQCSGPFQETMSAIYPSAAGTGADWEIIGVDGSQISPDPHSALSFGLINIGIFRMSSETAASPTQHTLSQLLLDQSEDGSIRMPGEEEINMIRDLEERQVLVNLAAESLDPIIALTDGPLGLFREPENNSPWKSRFDTLMNDYLRLPASNRIIAGYVDRPRSNMVVQMLELWLKAAPPSDDAPSDTLAGLRDEDLFLSLLPAAHRSAVFSLYSRSGRAFQDDLALHFFYLNVGAADNPALVRIEIPRWVAASSDLLERLHLQILQQCRILGTRPYPYVLHRAHEVAVVHQDEKLNLESMMMKFWMDKGLPIGDFSNKQFLKNLVGSRRRMP